MTTGRNDPCTCGSGLKFKRCCIDKVKFVPPETTTTYWNGEKTPCAKVHVVVADGIPPGWWCAGLEGTVRNAVRVEYNGSKFYLDNEDRSGWTKVTKGLGSPRYSHSSLPVKEEVVVDA
jgi:hypothetical protein